MKLCYRIKKGKLGSIVNYNRWTNIASTEKQMLFVLIRESSIHSIIHPRFHSY